MKKKIVIIFLILFGLFFVTEKKVSASSIIKEDVSFVTNTIYIQDIDDTNFIKRDMQLLLAVALPFISIAIARVIYYKLINIFEKKGYLEKIINAYQKTVGKIILFFILNLLFIAVMIINNYVYDVSIIIIAAFEIILFNDKLLYSAIEILILIIVSIIYYAILKNQSIDTCMLLIPEISFGLIVGYAFRKKYNLGEKIDKYDEIYYEELVLNGITNIEKLKKELYNNFAEIQSSIMNKDYEKLKPLVTNDLYLKYKRKRESLNNEKKVVKGLEYIDSKILSVERHDNKETLKLMLNIKMIEYVLNDNNEIIKGDDYTKIDNKYIVYFERNLASCPTCGRQVENNICSKCNSEVLLETNKYVMSKKENIKKWC